MADLTGRRLGKYELVERLGRGGMAEVYKAYQPGMDRFVAVKVLHSHLAETDDFVTRFKREAQLVGQLRHPHIVQVIDFDVADDVYYMVMEYIKGDTLKYYIQQTGAIPAEEALRIASYLADALSYAHQQGMIHRDIKPANVMFTDKAFSHPVLTDFGIARILSGETQLTASGAFVGTPAYISPETARGESVDERADIYSMGIMLYEMLTGKVPYDADTPFAVIMKHVNEPLPSPRQFNIPVTESIERVLFTALAKSPAERYVSAAEFRDALDHARDALATEQPTEVSTESATQRDLESADTVALGRANQDLPTFTYGAENAPTMGAPAQSYSTATPPKPNRWPLYAALAAILAVVLLGGLYLAGMFDSAPDEPRDNNDVVATEAVSPTEAIMPRDIALERADELFDAQDYSAAITAYSDLLIEAPDDIDLYQRRAQAYAAQGDFDAAIEDYSEALDIDSTRTDLYIDRGDAYLNIQNYELAVEDYNRVIDISPEAISALIQRGRAFFALGDLDQATADLERAIEIDPADARAYATRGEIAYATGNTDDATDDFNRAILLDPTNAAARIGRARLLLEGDSFEAALNELNLALEANPQDPVAYTERGFVYLELENYSAALSDFNAAVRNDSSYTRGYLGRGLIQFQLSNFEDAIEDLTVALEEEPDVAAFLQRALSYVEVDELEAALEDFEAVLDLDDTLTLAYLGVARIQDTLGNAEEAIAAYTRVLDAEPDNAEAVLSRGWLLLDQGEYDLAKPDFEAAVELNPTNPEAYLGLAEVQIEDNQLDDALENLDRALELNEALGAAYYQRGRAQLMLENNELAETDFSLALENSYEAPLDVFVDRGEARQAMGMYTEAVEDFEAALELDETNTGAYLGLINAQIELGLYGDALANIELVEDFEPEDTRFLDRLKAIALIETGELDTGLRAATIVLSQDPDDDDIRFYQAKANIELGNYQEAISALTYLIEQGYENLGEAHLQKGVALYRQGVYTRAIQELSEAIRQDDTLVMAYYQRGLTYRELDNEDDALADFSQTIELDPTFGGAYYYLGEIHLNNDDIDEAIANFDLALQNGFSDRHLAYLDRGVAFARKDDLPEAIRSYTRAIETRPDYALAYHNRGLAYYDLEDYDRAIINFSTAIDYDYYDPASAYYNRGLARYELQAFEQAIEDFTLSLDIDDNNPLAYFWRGSAYHDSGDYEAAVKDYTRAIEYNYEPLEFAYLNRGFSYSLMDDYDEAIENYTQAIEVNPDYALAYNNRAVAHLSLQENEEALEDYQKAFELGYDQTHWLYYGIGEANFNMGNLDVALKNLNLALEQLPDFQKALELRARVHLEMGDTAAALADISDVIALGDATADAYMLRGNLHLETGDYELAVSDFDRALLLDVELLDAYLARARANIALEQFDDASADLKRVLDLQPNNDEAYLALGNLYFDQQQREAALENYQAYVDIVGTNASFLVLNRIAQLEDQLSGATPVPESSDDTDVSAAPDDSEAAFAYIGYSLTLPTDSSEDINREAEIRQILDDQGVEAAYDQLIQKPVESTPMLALRSELQTQLANYDEALADAEAAIEVDPDHPAGYFARAYYFATVDYNEEEAVAQAQQALERAPDNGVAHMIYGNLLLYFGRYPEALDAYNQAETLDAPLLNVLFQRSLVYEEAGDFEGVIRDLSRYIEVLPRDLDARLRLAAAAILAGDTQRALDVVAENIETGDDDPVSFAQAAYVAYRNGDIDLAREWASTALGLSDDVPAATYVLGLLALETGELDQATSYFDSLSEIQHEAWRYDYPFLNPTFGHSVAVEQARILVQRGDLEAAIALLDEAIASEPYESLFYEVRGQIYADTDRGIRALRDYTQALALSDGLPTRISSVISRLSNDAAAFEIALNLTELYVPDLTMQVLDQLARDDDPRFMWLRGLSALQSENPDQALAIANELIAQSNVFGHLLMSAYHEASGDYELAEADLQSAIELDPDNPFVVLARARQLRSQGEYERAGELYQRLADMPIPPYRLLLERAEFRFQTRNFDAAIEDFKRLEQLASGIMPVDLIYFWAGSNILTDRPEDALEVVRLYIDYPVEDWRIAEFYASLAYISFRAGDDDLTAQLIERTEIYDPASVRLTYLRALQTYDAGDFDEALALYESFEDKFEWDYDYPYLNPFYDHHYLLDRARAARASGDLEFALNLLDELIVNESYWASGYMERAEIYLAMENVEAAIEDLRSAYEITEDPELRALLRDRLADLVSD